MKALTLTKWGKHIETLITTYKTLTQSIMEYANTIWAPIVAKTNLDKLQRIQNTALPIATECTKDTEMLFTFIKKQKSYH